MILDRCESEHEMGHQTWDSPSNSIRSDIKDRDGLGFDLDDEEKGLTPRPSSFHNLSSLMIPPSQLSPLQPLTQSYGSVRYRKDGSAKRKSKQDSIRFQVVVWDVGPVDVALGRVPMTFRVTMFWYDKEEESLEKPADEVDEVAKATHTEWSMQGRRKAYEHLIRDTTIVKSADVPSLSLLNVVTFDIIGQPEVGVLREQERVKNGVRQKRRLMRWTCLYKATLLQHNMKLNDFPHDEHVLCLRLGILVNRRSGSRWDLTKYKLDLATEDDSQHSTRIPHGMIVDHARVPGFSYDQEEGLSFEFVPLSMGADSLPLGAAQNNEEKQQQDSCLEVRLRVKRDSGHYDKNIMPLLGLLNVVAVTIPLSLEGIYFFQRALLLMNITFVQIGIRMNVDKHLPSVGYQIKMQRIMNHFFFSLLALVLESSLVYILHDQMNWSLSATHRIDKLAATASFSHIVLTWAFYYSEAVMGCGAFLGCFKKEAPRKRI